MKKKILSVLKYLVFLVIGGLLFWLAIRGEDINKILNEFEHANYGWIAFSVFFMFISHVFRALRWNLLIDTLNYKTKTVTTFYAVMIGYFVNLAVPRLGEVTRCGVLAKHDKIPVNSVIGTVIAERAFDVITLLIIILITIVSQISFLSDFITKTVISPFEQKFLGSFVIIASGGVIVIILLISAIYLYKIFKKKAVEGTFAHKIKNLIDGFIHGIKTIRHIKNKKLFLFYSFLMWLMYFMTIFVAFSALKSTSHLALIDALTILAMGSIGVLAPTPGGIGAYQYVVGLTLVGLFALDKVPAFSFANILYFTQWFMIIITGGISWMMLFLLQRKKCAT